MNSLVSLPRSKLEIWYIDVMVYVVEMNCYLKFETNVDGFMSYNAFFLFLW